MQLINKVASFDHRLLDRVSASLYSRIDTWMVSHPLIQWLINHSLISIIAGFIVIVLIIRLLLTIYYSIAATIDRMWLWLLRSPYLLLKYLLGWEVKSKDSSSNTTITNYEVTNNPEELQEIITRLEHIQKQQRQIVQDIAILKERCDPTLSQNALWTAKELEAQVKAKAASNDNLAEQATQRSPDIKSKAINLQPLKKKFSRPIIENEL